MDIVLDSKEDQSLAQLCSFLDIQIRHAANRNENGLLELMLGCIGLSSLVDYYEYFFNPYSFNRSYRNDNDYFNPEMGMLKICNQIKNNKELLNDFLVEIFSRLHRIEIEDEILEKIKNSL